MHQTADRGPRRKLSDILLRWTLGNDVHKLPQAGRTRTTRAGLLARATVAPLRVNFHIEHHLMPAVPYFRLPAMHRMLCERGLVAAPPGYLDVLRIVSARAPSAGL